MTAIDLRSDTVTRPTQEMRSKMVTADVGDDVYGEDPSVRDLEEYVADMLGKPAALFVPSGTMSNQLALLAQTRRGDEVVVGERAHVAWFESGAGAALAGVQFAVAGRGGLFDEHELIQAIKADHYYLPRTSLVALENTHNASGGRVFPQGDVLKIAEQAHARGLRVHLDGARLWNASAATGLSPAELCAPADSVSVCFSKGLGAPVGSALVGSRELVTDCRRLRKMLGGGMRQAGMLAAAAIYALGLHLGRLREDHDNARLLAEALSSSPYILLDPNSVQTNILVFKLTQPRAGEFVKRARELGILLHDMGVDEIRAVTHLDVSRDAIEQAGPVLVELSRKVCS